VRTRAPDPPEMILNPAVLAYAEIGRAALPLAAPAELARRAELLEAGRLDAGDERRTVNDMRLVASALTQAAGPGRVNQAAILCHRAVSAGQRPGSYSSAP